jgi:hypothetical protein
MGPDDLHSREVEIDGAVHRRDILIANTSKIPGAEMKILFYPPTGEIDLSADQAGISRLADLVASGTGMMVADDALGGFPDQVSLTQVRIRVTDGRAVAIGADAGDRSLSISGDLADLRVLAGNLRQMAATDDGGHLHIDYHPDHSYLAEGSLPLVVNSPRGGMPNR